MKKMALKLLAGVLAGAFLLSGCSTVQGFGEDVEKGGKAIQKQAKKHS